MHLKHKALHEAERQETGSKPCEYLHHGWRTSLQHVRSGVTVRRQNSTCVCHLEELGGVGAGESHRYGWRILLAEESGSRRWSHRLDDMNNSWLEPPTWGIGISCIPGILPAPAALIESPARFCHSFCFRRFFPIQSLPNCAPLAYKVTEPSTWWSRSIHGRSSTVVWCTQNAPRWQQFHVAPAIPAL